MASHDSPRLRLFAAGVVTGLAGIATSEVTRAFMHLESGPVVSVAEAVRDATPGSLAVTLVHLVQHLDKPLLVAGTTVVLLALTGLAGVLHPRRPWAGIGLLFLLAVVGGIAILSGEDATGVGIAPLGVGLITWLVLLPWLTGAALREPAVPTAGRRDFLLRAGGVGAAAVVGVGLSRLLGAGRAKVEQARDALKLRVTRGGVPEGNDANPVEPWRTPNSRFYQIDTALVVPQIVPEEWRLRVHGMVEKPFEIGYDELVRMGLEEHWVTLCCVSNVVGGDLVGNAHWSGVPVRDLLARAGVRAGADAVKQTSDDGWTCGTPLGALTDPDRDAILAVAMNGVPLPVEHGFPVRMVVPGLYGYVSATKWLVDLEVTRFDDFSAYWTQRGWGEKGPVKTMSRIDVPDSGGGVSAGKVPVAGYAWAQHTGIERVEVRIDGGDWAEATLGRVPTDDTWVQWSYVADLASGKHEATVRATDKSGYTQTSDRADVLPDGATGWDSVSFTVG